MGGVAVIESRQSEIDVEEIILRVTECLKGDNRILAAWLAGSYGRGEKDAYSDFDFVACVGSVDDRPNVFEFIAQSVKTQFDLILTKQIARSQTLNCITRNWQRIDITVVTLDDLQQYNKSQINILFDKNNVIDRLAERISHTPSPDEQAQRLKADTEEFIRVLGLLPVVLGREDYVTAILGAQILKDKLINCMILDRQLPFQRGMLSLKQSLGEGYYQQLVALPPLLATRDAVIEAYRVVAEMFFPLAKTLYARYEMTWPEEFYTATLQHISETFEEDRIN